MRTLLAALLASFGIAAPAAAHHLTWVESLVAGGPGDQFDAHVSGDIVSVGGIVWTDTSGGDANLRALTRFGDASIAFGTGNQDDADISGDTVAFITDAAGDNDLWKFDISTGVRTPVSATATIDTAPAISGQRVAFMRGLNLFLTDLETGASTIVASFEGNPSAPDIDGDLIVWQQFNGTDYDVWAAQVGGAPFPVAASSAQETQPSASGNRIAYLSGGQVHLYHVAMGTDTPITNDAFPKGKVVLAGELIAWSDRSTGNLDIYMHDLSSGETVQVTHDARDQNLTDFDGTTLVFDDERNGSLAGLDVRRIDLAFGSCTSSPDPNGLLGYWPFSGNAEDWSGSGRDGTPEDGTAACTQTFVTGAAGDELDAHVSGDIVSVGGVVWTNISFNGSGNVRAWTRFGSATAIAFGPGNQADADISGDTIAYVDDASGSNDILLFDISTGTRRTLLASALDEESPAVSNNKLAYILNPGPWLRFFDTFSQVGSDLDVPGNLPSSPAIDGTLVAWERHNGANSDIFAIDLANLAGGPFPVAATAASSTRPHVSGSRIAYLEGGLPHAYDVATGIDTDFLPSASAVKISGDRLVWQSGSDLFVRDLGTHEVKHTAIDPSAVLTDFDGGIAVFEADDGGVSGTGIRSIDLASCTPLPAPSAPTPDRAGLPNSAFAFEVAADGTAYHVDLGNDPTLRRPLPVTMSAWVEHQCTDPSQLCPIFANDMAEEGLFGVRLYLVSVGPGDVRVGTQFNDSGASGGGIRRKTGTSSIPAGAWTHVAAVIRGPGDVDLYVNGVDDGGTYSGFPGSGGGVLRYAGGPAQIGRGITTSWPVPSYFEGKLDEVTFYGRALAPEEIAAQRRLPCYPVVRDNIGVDSAATDGTAGAFADEGTGFRNVVSYEIPPGNGGRFLGLDVVAGTPGGSCGGSVACYDQMAFRFLGWSSRAAVSADPASGDLFDLYVSAYYTLTPEFGSFESGGSWPTSLLEFDLSGSGTSCPDTGCVVALVAEVTDSPDRFEIRRSKLLGPQDVVYVGGSPGTPLPGPAGVRIVVPEPGSRLLLGVAVSAVVLLAKLRERRARTRVR